MDPVGNGADSVAVLVELGSGDFPVEAADAVGGPVDSHGQGGEVVLLRILLIQGQQTQDPAVKRMFQAVINSTGEAVVAGLDRGVDGVNHLAGRFIGGLQNSLIAGLVTKIVAQSAMEDLGDQGQHQNHPMLFIEMNSFGAKPQGPHRR